MKKLHREKTAVPALFGEIEEARLALQTAYANLEEVIDPDLIDCYIYQVNSVQKRYQYLLRLAASQMGTEQ